MKIPFKWKLDGFNNENAPIILLGYKNEKWKNCNNIATITSSTTDKDTFIISLVNVFRLFYFSCKICLIENIIGSNDPYSLLARID